MLKDKGLEKIGDIFLEQAETLAGRAGRPAPIYVWQDLALRVIKELEIPNFKRSAVFKVCKQYPKFFIEKCLNDTKELCRTGEKWKYFFKIIGGKSDYKKEIVGK